MAPCAMRYSVYCTEGLYTPPLTGPKKAEQKACLTASKAAL